MLLLPWPALFLPPVWNLTGVAIAILAGLAALYFLARRQLPKLPLDGQLVALPPESLLTGELQVKWVMAPEKKVAPTNVKAGSSMMLCLHAAALLSGRDEPESAALIRSLKMMKAAP